MNQSPNDFPIHTPDGKFLRWLPRIAGAWAVALIIGYAIIFRALPVNERPDAWGQFGDYMGGLLNPLISLFTLIVAVSVWNLQKTELLETRKALEEQAKTAEQQRREQRFFDLLDLYRSTVDTIAIPHNKFDGDNNSGAAATGKRALSLLISNPDASPFDETVRKLFQPAQPDTSSDPSQVKSQWQKHSPVLDHYFRVIFTLLCEAEFLLQNDRHRYIKILRAQLSRDEVNLIAMNLLYDEEGKRMRELVAEYGFLKHLPHNHLRTIAEKELHPGSFGQKWAVNHILAPSQAASC